MRPLRTILATAVLGPVVVLAVPDGPAGAAAPVVSATSGVPGDRIAVSVPGCTVPEDGLDAYGEVLLITGTAPDQLLAGVGPAFGDETVHLVIPDWVDPEEPAVLETTCTRYGWDEDTGEITTDVERYDDVAFDILPGEGPVTQTVTLSRSELAVGQAFEVRGTGCDPDAEYGLGALFDTADLSGRDTTGMLVFASAPQADGEFTAQVALNTSGVTIYTETDGTTTSSQVEEWPTTLEPGSYALLSYCGTDGGDILILRPELITVTGTRPVGEIDLTAEPDSRRFTLAGSSCTETVHLWLEATDADNLWTFEAKQRPRPWSASPLGLAETGRDGFDARGRRASRVLDDGVGVEGTLPPGPDGSWAVTDETAFDHGYVLGSATCGDPLTDGFQYDVQAVAIDRQVPEPPPTTQPPTPEPPGPPPAQPRPGRPNYAG